MNENSRSIEKLIDIIKHLRSPEGCPWDQKQTHESLKPMLIEETAELLDAIDFSDTHNIKEELGDILMHVVFHSLLAEEKGFFTFTDVIEEISDKMQRRHPHVFGKKPKLSKPEEVIKQWHEIKAKERDKNRSAQINSIISRIPHNMPALTRAEMIQNKVKDVGFEWTNLEEVVNKIDEEIQEFKAALKSSNIAEIEEEIGDLLFTIVNLCSFMKLRSAETLLQKSSDKFTKRFQAIEKTIKAENKNFENYSLQELELLWQKVKKLHS